MRNQQHRAELQTNWATRELESRALLSTVPLILSGLVVQLGTVTRQEASLGVKATAFVEPTSTTTFQFNLQDAGDYTLYVEHLGIGLSLNAHTPGGTKPIDPGQAGRFEVVPLHLDAGKYQITAEASTGQRVFLDWELLLNNGVSQSFTSVASLITPVVAIPQSVPVSGPVSSPDANPDIIPESSQAFLPVAGFGQSFQIQATTYLASEPMGHPTPSRSSPLTNLASHPHPIGNPMDAGLAEFDAALLIALQTSLDLPTSTTPIRADHSWLDKSLASIEDVPLPAPKGETTLTSSDTELARLEVESPSTGANSISLVALSPGLVMGSLALTIATRKRMKQANSFRRPSHLPSLAAGRTVEPTIQRLLGIMNRTYRPGRCDPAHPLCAPALRKR